MRKKSKVTKKTKKVLPMTSSVRKNVLDVLICHGLNKDLVADLINLGRSIGLNTNNVLGLPSYKFNQDERVKFCIKNSKLIIVLLTFDPEEPASRKSRSNVYDELRIAFDEKPKDLIILQEENDTGELVIIPSNLSGKGVIIQFNRKLIHKMYPVLLTEINSRVLKSTTSEISSKLTSGGLLNKFLDQMDRIWEDEFDLASDNVVSNDWVTEKKIAELLDKYFQCYWQVVNSIFRLKVSNEELKNICQDSLITARTLALEAWKTVAESKYKRIEEEIKLNSKSKKIVAIKKDADRAFSILRRKSDRSIDKSADYREVIDILTNCQSSF